MYPVSTDTGSSVLDFSFATGGWSYSGVVEEIQHEHVNQYDYSAVVRYDDHFNAMLSASRHTNALLYQLTWFAVLWSVAALSLACFKGFNHFIGYHGSAKKG